MYKGHLILVFSLSLGWLVPVFSAYSEEGIGSVAASAEEVSPLSVGGVVPQAEIRSPSDEVKSIHEVLDRTPTVLIFYRGGWCPYCNTHLGQLATIEGKLSALGFQIVAVSPDRPAKIRENEEKFKEVGVRASSKYQLYSDSSMALSKAFGLAFKVDDETVAMYKEKYKIDLEGDSGERHHLLPVPAAYVIDKAGKLTFRYFNSDYKQRVDVDQLLRAAKEAVEQ